MTLINDDCLAVLKTMPENSIDSLVTDPPAGISFMGKAWDHDLGGRLQWIAWMTLVMAECKRVMKPGAHGLVWALPRTSHWTATALEEAGFEIRDVVTHLFGSGFPKSLNIGKALPEWQGWGTALKPASEHWILIRKPCSEKTVAANVLKWGTGALNIDASRIEASKDYGRSAANSKGTVNAHEGFDGKAFKIAERDAEYASPLGRFPANLVLSGDAPEMLDEQSGTLKSGSIEPHHGGSMARGLAGKMQSGTKLGSSFQGDSGGASRFFYCAKISTSERGEGNTHPTVKPQKLMRYLIRMITPPGGIVLDPFMGSGSTGLAAKTEGFGFTGIEKEFDYYNIAEKRINAELL